MKKYSRDKTVSAAAMWFFFNQVFCKNQNLQQSLFILKISSEIEFIYILSAVCLLFSDLDIMTLQKDQNQDDVVVVMASSIPESYELTSTTTPAPAIEFESSVGGIADDLR